MSILEGVKSGMFKPLYGPKLSELFNTSDANAVRASLEVMSESERDGLYGQELARRARENQLITSKLGGPSIFSQLETQLPRADSDMAVAGDAPGYTSMFGMDAQRRARAVLVDHARMIDNRSDPEFSDALASTELFKMDATTGQRRTLNAAEALQGIKERDPEVIAQIKRQWETLSPTQKSMIKSSSSVYQKLFNDGVLDVVAAAVPGKTNLAGDLTTFLPKERATAAKAMVDNALTLALQTSGYIPKESKVSEQEAVNAAMMGGPSVLASSTAKVTAANYDLMQDPTFSDVNKRNALLELRGPEQLGALRKNLLAQAKRYLGVIKRAEGSASSSRMQQTAVTVDAMNQLLQGIKNISITLGASPEDATALTDSILSQVPSRWQAGANTSTAANNDVSIPKPVNIGLKSRLE